MNSYCWVRNTYYHPFVEGNGIPDESEKKYILYYQWISFILIGQAILFYLPSQVWHGLNQKAGIDVDSICASASTYHSLNNEPKRQTLRVLIANLIARSVENRHGRVAGCKIPGAGRSENY